MPERLKKMEVFFMELIFKNSCTLIKKPFKMLLNKDKTKSLKVLSLFKTFLKTKKLSSAALLPMICNRLKLSLKTKREYFKEVSTIPYQTFAPNAGKF